MDPYTCHLVRYKYCHGSRPRGLSRGETPMGDITTLLSLHASFSFAPRRGKWQAMAPWCLCLERVIR